MLPHRDNSTQRNYLLTNLPKKLCGITFNCVHTTQCPSTLLAASSQSSGLELNGLAFVTLIVEPVTCLQ